MIVTDQTLAALRLAREFAEAEVENRGAAGASMSDYQDEAQQVFDALDAALAAAQGEAVEVPDTDAVCTACRWRFAHAPDCHRKADPWPTVRSYSQLTWEALSDRVRVLEAAAREACDLLAERTYGSPARSPGHNARLTLEAALAGGAPASKTAEGIE